MEWGSPPLAGEMQGWAARPLQGVYAAIFIDAIYVKVAWLEGRAGG